MNLLSTVDIAFIIVAGIFFLICLLAGIYLVQKESDESNFEVMLYDFQNRVACKELEDSQLRPSRRERDEGEDPETMVIVPKIT